jgi:hypothetical protein
LKLTLTCLLGLFTVKYIYGPATVAAANDAVIGSSISGRLEAGIAHYQQIDDNQYADEMLQRAADKNRFVE